MGTIQNLLSSPNNAIQYILKSARKNLNTTPVYVVGFSAWKQVLRKYFPKQNLIFLPKNITPQEFSATWEKKILSQSKAEIFIWGFKAPEFILDFARKNGKQLRFIEDGFIRSIELGAQKAPPMSLTVDTRTPYFNSREASDLELLLSTYDFASEPSLLARAQNAIQQIIENGVSKYNNAPRTDILKLYGNKDKKRILVIGQVEDDASIKYGCAEAISNNQLVRLAVKENPGAQVLYKIHPDVLAGNRLVSSQPSEVASICTLFIDNIPLSHAFHEVDHVYTITSLAGFEALLRGIKVTTIGCPFYSGWGVTDDRQPSPRRTRKLSTVEIFAAAYILYPQYFDVETGAKLAIEDVIATISDGIKTIHSTPAPSSLAPFEIEGAVAEEEDTLTQPKAKSTKPNYTKIPEWFNPRQGEQLTAAARSEKPLYLYVPWISGHTDALINKISDPDKYHLIPLDYISDLDRPGVRQEVLRFTRANPALYRKMLINRLVPLRSKISGIVFTFDWNPVMRVLASVCEELEIPKILIPHESVFVDREKYYWDITSQASVPLADLILGWGDLQKEIFVDSGFPEDRFITVGAPKFDTYVNFEAALSRNQYCKLFGLSANKKIILFATQPLDSQTDKKVAQESQRAAIGDLLKVVKEQNAQLIVRLPPNKEDVLGSALKNEIVKSDFAAIDDGECYLVPPEEAIFHAEIVTSVNSTMLFEALLMNRMAVSLKYVDFNQIWEQAGIPAVFNYEGLSDLVVSLLKTPAHRSEEGMAWAAKMFSNGTFDGGASSRIKNILASIANGSMAVPRLPTPLERLFAKQQLDVVAIPSAESAFTSTQLYVPSMLNARQYITTAGVFAKQDVASVDIFFQWGISESNNKKRQHEFAREMGKPVVFLEDGFIRSLDIGLSKEPGLSIILDDRTAYYDATKVSRLAGLLEQGPNLDQQMTERCTKAIHKIVSNRVSKYNHAPDVKLNIGTPGRKKVLLVDQRFGDQSVASGLGSDAAFEKMLKDVLKNCADCDIIIKQHPDAIKGGKSSYFSNERLAFTQYMDNVHPVLFDVNPFALFDLVDDVYVMTSGMGFEALMAGKKVHCYGMPFYAGWGETCDQQTLATRTRRRTIEEIFYFSYIESSRYFDPSKNKNVEVEDIVDHIVALRDA